MAADAPTAIVVTSQPGYYGDGMRYVFRLVDSVISARAGRPMDAINQAGAADRLLGPLGDENDPEALRDFIAGAARAAEAWLELSGVHLS